MIRRKPNRRGYALVVTAIFCLLFVSFLGIAWRQMASSIRTFSIRSNHVQEDQAAILALAQVMKALEVGAPPLATYATNPCYCEVSVPVMESLKIKYSVNGSLVHFPTSQETYYFTVDFTRKTTEETGSDRVYDIILTKREKPAESEPVTKLNINDFGNTGRL